MVLNTFIMPTMDFLFNIFTSKENQVSKFSSFTDPYSSNLAYFFKKVAATDPHQLKLLQEYSKFPELRKYIHVEIKSNGDIAGLELTDEKGYEEAKSELIESNE
jgi:hypothetical protein